MVRMAGHWSPHTTTSLHTSKIENNQMPKDQKLLFEKFCEIVANIPKMKL